jgi:hypothetical protein
VDGRRGRASCAASLTGMWRPGGRSIWRWGAVALALGGSSGPERWDRLVVARSDPRTLPRWPQARTWSLLTTLPLPGTTRAAEPPDRPPAAVAEGVRLDGWRQGIEQGEKPGKQELGWADFPVRSDRAIRRHWAVVGGALAYCWWAQSVRTPSGSLRELRHPPPPVSRSPTSRERGEKEGRSPPTPVLTEPMASSRLPATAPATAPSWPRALRHIQRWLDPWRRLRRSWQAWSHAPPPPALQALLDAVTRGQPLYLYLRL